MTIYRIALITLVISSSLMLTGFKKAPKKSVHPKAVKTQIEAQPKALNLAIPKLQAIVDDPDVNKPLVSNDSPELFDADLLPRKTPVGLRGQVIQTPEPEAGKMKSADGAGIIFDFQP